MVAVVVVAGGVGYAVLSTVSGTEGHSNSTCAPASICSPVPGTVVMFVSAESFGQYTGQFSQGQGVTSTVGVSGPEFPSQYEISWGDGSTYVGPNPTSSHTYSSLGSYILSARALVGASWYNGSRYLYPLEVVPSEETTDSGYYPTLATTLANGSSAPWQAGWLAGSGTIHVSADYTSNSTASGVIDRAPTLTSTGGSESELVSTPTSVAGSFLFTVAGEYYITMVGAITTVTGTSYQNYTWTVIVSPVGVAPGCADCNGTSPLMLGSPHPGKIVFQEVAPGGATSMDPSVAYDPISEDPILNVYQTLVTYNGSRTNSWVPEASLCVPGPGCAAMFGGNTLIQNNATNGEEEYYTFPIDPAAHFYDASQKVSWNVYPSDVMFTLSRTCGFANLPGVGSAPGWIQCQSLLNPGSFTWDGGIHGIYNNTPADILGSMLINDTKYCPPNVMAKSNGCITFNVWGGGGITWPFFLELVSDPMGSSVEPCGWFSYMGANVPGFAGTNAPKGDGPCYLPGPPGQTSTNTSSWSGYLSSLRTNSGVVSWDAFEELSLGIPEVQPGVQWSLVGSGPYYATWVNEAHGYSLEQNPAYQAPTGCAGQFTCQPLPGETHYAANVTVVYEPTDAVGIKEYQAGQADFASIFPSETTQMLELLQDGKIGAIATPTLNIQVLAFAMEFDVAEAQSVDPQPINVPGDFFSHIGLREFLVHAFPYDSVENTIFTTDDVPSGINYGGVIPQFLGNYYPVNVSFPTGDPGYNSSIPGSAAWWWAQATTTDSPYYDPELVACTLSDPCQFPIMGFLEYEPLSFDEMMVDYLGSISSLSGGRVAPTTFHCGDECTEQLVYSGDEPSLLTMFDVGWTPDYPDPTDYVTPFYLPNATFTGGDSVYPALEKYVCANSPDLTGAPPTPLQSEAALFFWAHQAAVPNACQGNAYSAMTWGMLYAAGIPNGPLRGLMYNLVEHIANSLALYVYDDQQISVITYASWIDPVSINTNPVIGAAGEHTWYSVFGSGIA